MRSRIAREMDSKQLVAVVVHVLDGERVLGMRRSSRRTNAGLWETVSGRVEPGECPLAAAAREAVEETSLSVEVDPRPVDAYSATRGAEPMVVVVYRARRVAGEPVISDEHDALQWCTADELAALGAPGRLVASVRAAVTLR